MDKCRWGLEGERQEKKKKGIRKVGVGKVGKVKGRYG